MGDIVQELVERRKADIEAHEHYEIGGATPLIHAIQSGHNDIVMFLLEKGADVMNRQHNRFEWTPLHVACKVGNQEAVKALLAKEADPNAFDQLGNNPARWARNARHQNILS